MAHAHICCGKTTACQVDAAAPAGYDPHPLRREPNNRWHVSPRSNRCRRAAHAVPSVWKAPRVILVLLVDAQGACWCPCWRVFSSAAKPVHPKHQGGVKACQEKDMSIGTNRSLHDLRSQRILCVCRPMFWGTFDCMRRRSAAWCALQEIASLRILLLACMQMGLMYPDPAATLDPARFASAIPHSAVAGESCRYSMEANRATEALLVNSSTLVTHLLIFAVDRQSKPSRAPWFDPCIVCSLQSLGSHSANAP